MTTKDEEETHFTITTHRTGQVYLEEGWYTYEELEEMVKCNERIKKQLLINIGGKTKTK